MQFGQAALQKAYKHRVKRHFVLPQRVGSILDNRTFANNFLPTMNRPDTNDKYQDTTAENDNGVDIRSRAVNRDVHR